jgi:hypothetical protein
MSGLMLYSYIYIYYLGVFRRRMSLPEYFKIQLSMT